MSLHTICSEIKACKICEPNLALGANPIFTANEKAKIIIIGQAPGKAVHNTNINWNDKSGDNLRNWLGVDKENFYNEEIFSVLPMGFCYPGTGKSGDLPPKKECAPLYHEELIKQMPNVQLTLLIGKYAQDYYLKKKAARNLTETVKNYKAYLPNYFVLPHPSPRNNIWQAKNEWFKRLLIPELQLHIHAIIK